MRDTVLYIAAALLALVLIAFFFYGKNAGPKYRWFTTYSRTGDQPYDVKFFHDLLSQDRKVVANLRKPIHKLLDSAEYEDGNADYLLIGSASYYDDKDIEALKGFISQGNNAIIITDSPPSDLILDLLPTACSQESFEYQSKLEIKASLNFYHPVLAQEKPFEYSYRFLDHDAPYDWYHIAPVQLCDTLSHLQPLGYQLVDSDEYVNFAAIPYGKGNLYIHTVPIIFTNYFLTKEHTLDYISGVLSHLDGDEVIWDEVSKLMILSRNGMEKSPLYYILDQPALKYAWWMFLAAALLYVVFASKRKQRIIPVLEKKTNTSLEFLNVISSLHYQNLNHLDIAKKKMKYFLYFIRAKYGMHLQTFGDEHVKRLSEKSKVPIEDVQQIADNFKVIEKYSISNDEPNRLINLFQSIQRFYKTCK